MDTALHISGDWAVDAQAHPYIITDKEEKQQQLYIRLSAVKGGFLYDRTLGSALAYLDISRPDAVQQAEALARQALAQEPSAEVTILVGCMSLWRRTTEAAEQSMHALSPST